MSDLLEDEEWKIMLCMDWVIQGRTYKENSPYFLIHKPCRLEMNGGYVPPYMRWACLSCKKKAPHKLVNLHKFLSKLERL